MKRSSGVLMHISSLYGKYSVGSLGKEAYEWIDYLSDVGFGYWQVLPFCLPDECNSPYKSYSAFSTNPYFIDLPALFNEGLITEDELSSAEQKTPYSCEFKRLSEERLALLRLAASRFTDKKSMDKFLKTHRRVDEFCTFMALRRTNGEKPWQEWDKSEPDTDELRLWQFTQYMFYIQWMKLKEYANAKGIKIIGDIPIYVALDSADVWASPEMFKLDSGHKPTEVAGVPPDYFSEDGQLWGNPLYNWKKMKTDGYSWWCERMAFMTELFDGVRIDHFRGIESYFSIPASAKTAKAGKWIKGPGMDFVRAMKKVAKDKLIIAEDLGDITPAVEKLVKDSGFPGMRVLQFAFLGDGNSIHLPHNYSENCIAYTGTHDNNTLLGYIWESSEAERGRLFEYCGYTGADLDASYPDIMRTVLMSAAPIAVFPVQDLLFYGADTRFNTPGQSAGNWSYRITREQLMQINRQRLTRWLEIYGRK